jgi:hypothetical protein
MRQGYRGGTRDEPSAVSPLAHRSWISASCAGGRTSIVAKLTGGLAMLAKQRKVEVVRGSGKFISPHCSNSRRRGSERIRFRTMHHRRGLRVHATAGTCPKTRASSIPPARWNCPRSRAVSGHWRRHHRTGDGLCLRCARGRRQRRGAHAQLDARHRSRIWCARCEQRIRARYERDPAQHARGRA